MSPGVRNDVTSSVRGETVYATTPKQGDGWRNAVFGLTPGTCVIMLRFGGPGAVNMGFLPYSCEPRIERLADLFRRLIRRSYNRWSSTVMLRM
jgi:hypothetical protein